MKYHYDVEQRTDEWHALRLGRITGTSFTTMANGTAKGRKTLVDTIVAERRLQRADDGYVNADMVRGAEMEAEAIARYEAETFLSVRPVGFVSLNEFVGCSPDGLVGDDGGVEAKCPAKGRIHMGYINAGDDAWKAHKWQVQGSLWVTDRKWKDFISYFPCPATKDELFICRVTPDDECFDKLESGMALCLKMIAEIEGAANVNVPSD